MRKPTPCWSLARFRISGMAFSPFRMTNLTVWNTTSRSRLDEGCGEGGGDGQAPPHWGHDAPVRGVAGPHVHTPSACHDSVTTQIDREVYIPSQAQR
mmetsp:Transcript_135498/g.235081  ORF Transcript_135498/g.235081 Transcript_135498/m.235081 type:complete len:97 (+) Transcript_135498:1155-1445(+)